MFRVKTYVQAARLIALDAHSGQVDKGGQRYDRHPERVAEAVAHLGPEYEAAAWLHDVVEDSDWTLADVADFSVQCGQILPPEVLRAVAALTKEPGEPYLDAVRRAAADPIARAVKLADNADNSDRERLAALDPATAGRLRNKYGRARAVLLDEKTE